MYFLKYKYTLELKIIRSDYKESFFVPLLLSLLGARSIMVFSVRNILSGSGNVIFPLGYKRIVDDCKLQERGMLPDEFCI